jgi:putative ABC transport system permease protein
MATSVTSRGPLNVGDPHDLVIEGRRHDPGERPLSVSVMTIGPRYFETLRLPLLRGRPFNETDGAPGQASVIVNDRFVATFFPNANPLGTRLRVTDRTAKASPPRWATIVGVSPSVKQLQADAPGEVVYLPFGMQGLPYSNVHVIARSGSGTQTAASRLREEMRALDPDLPLFDVSTFDEGLASLRAPQRVFGTLFAIFAGMALMLAAIGLYAVGAHSVVQRTREIAIRGALGARPSSIRWLIMRRGLVELGVGLALGLGGALGVGKLVNGMWARGNDPATLVVVTAVVTGVALAACFWPARRASRLDTWVALRQE